MNVHDLVLWQWRAAEDFRQSSDYPFLRLGQIGGREMVRSFR